MPRYFFNSIDSQAFPDREGTELPDIESAKREAVSFLGHTLRDRPDLACNSRYYGVEVTDEEGKVLFTTVALTIDASAVLPTAKGSNDP